VCKQIQLCNKDDPVHVLPLAKQGRIKILAVLSKTIKCWDPGPSRVGYWEEAMDAVVEDIAVEWD